MCYDPRNKKVPGGNVMKSIIMTVVLCMISLPLAAQWATNGSTAYYDAGNVAVGKNTAAERLEVRGNILLANGSSAAYLRLASAYTYLWFEPVGTAFGSAFIQAGTNNNFSGTGNYMGFHVPLGRQFLFDGDVVIQNGISGSARWLMGLDGGTTFRIQDTTAGTGGIRMSIAANGDATFSGKVSGANISAHYQDIAEWVPTSDELPPGTVVAVDPQSSNHVVAASHAYDTAVAGVISPQPGIMLGEPGDDKVLVATTGRVRVRVDAGVPIRRGDLLVSSERRGYAMRSVPVEIGGVAVHRPGTVIGKALEPLAEGTGEILVLLTLQ